MGSRNIKEYGSEFGMHGGGRVMWEASDSKFDDSLRVDIMYRKCNVMEWMDTGRRWT